MNNYAAKHLFSAYHGGILKIWNSEVIQQSNKLILCWLDEVFLGLTKILGNEDIFTSVSVFHI